MNKIRRQANDEMLTDLQKSAFTARRNFILRQYELYKTRYDDAMKMAEGYKQRGMEDSPSYLYHIDNASRNQKQMEVLMCNDEELFI